MLDRQIYQPNSKILPTVDDPSPGANERPPRDVDKCRLRERPAIVGHNTGSNSAARRNNDEP